MKIFYILGEFCLQFIMGAMLMEICILLFGDAEWKIWSAFGAGVLILIPFLLWHKVSIDERYKNR